MGPRTVSGIRNEVVAFRWSVIRVSVNVSLANCDRYTQIGGNGGFDVGRKGSQRRVERVVERVAVEADVVAVWVEVGEMDCGEIHSDAPKKRNPSAE